jgi:hypothetical protein
MTLSRHKKIIAPPCPRPAGMTYDTFLAPQVGPERTEGAAIDADVGRVEVGVDVVVGRVAVLPLADQIRQLAQFRQRHLGRFEHEAIVEREPLAGFDFFADWGQER